MISGCSKSRAQADKVVPLFWRSPGIRSSPCWWWRGGDCAHVGVLFCLWIYCISEVNRGHLRSLSTFLPLVLFAQFFSISASLPSGLPKRPDSVTNFIQYFCQSLYFALTSTHSLVNPSRSHAACALIWTSHSQPS